MAAAKTEPVERVITADSGNSPVGEAVRELVRYRVLLWSMVARHVEARYRGSVLGLFWSVVHPLLLMSVYTLVFRYYMRFDQPNYPVFLLCGILAWGYFSGALADGTNSVIAGGNLITRSLFPAHVLPTMTVLSHLVNYLLSLPVLALLLFWVEAPVGWSLLLLPVILLMQTVFTWGLVLTLAALNVHFRDTQHVLANVLLLWFFLSPIVYPASQIPEAFRAIHHANPIGLMIEAYATILLYGEWPSTFALAEMAVASVAAVVVGTWVFEHYRDTFPELI